MSALKKYGITWLVLTLSLSAFLFDRMMPQAFIRVWLPVIAASLLIIAFILTRFRLRISLNASPVFKFALLAVVCLLAAAAIFIPRSLNNRALLAAAGDDFDVTIHGRIEQERIDHTLISLEKGWRLVYDASNFDLPEADIKIEIYQDIDQLCSLTGLETWAAGFTIYTPEGPVIHIPAELDDSAIDDTPGHEVVHAVVYQFIGAKIKILPSWFSEGLAQYVSEAGIWNLPDRDVARLGLWRSKDSVMRPDYFYSYQPDNPRSEAEIYLFYDSAHEFMRYLAAVCGSDCPWRVIDAVKQGISFDQAFSAAVGGSFEQHYVDWVKAFWGMDL